MSFMKCRVIRRVTILLDILIIFVCIVGCNKNGDSEDAYRKTSKENTHTPTQEIENEQTDSSKFLDNPSPLPDENPEITESVFKMLTPTPFSVCTPGVVDPDLLTEEEWNAFIDSEEEQIRSFWRDGYTNSFKDWYETACLMKSEVTGGKTQGQLLQHTEYLFYYNNMIATVHQYLYYDFSGTPDDPDEVLITFYPDATKLLATPITVWHSYRGANGKIECDEIFLDGTTLKSFEEEVISRVENDEFTIEMFETNSFILRFRTQKVNPYMRPALTLVLYYFDGVYGVKIDNPHRDFGVALYIVDDESSNSDTSLNTAREAERIQLASFYEKIDY